MGDSASTNISPILDEQSFTLWISVGFRHSFRDQSLHTIPKHRSHSKLWFHNTAGIDSTRWLSKRRNLDQRGIPRTSYWGKLGRYDSSHSSQQDNGTGRRNSTSLAWAFADGHTLDGWCSWSWPMSNRSWQLIHVPVQGFSVWNNMVSQPLLSSILWWVLFCLYSDYILTVLQAVYSDL